MPASVHEPPRISKLSTLAPALLVRAVEGLRAARADGLPVAPFETFRTAERQRWLYESGRERPGSIVTKVSDPAAGWHCYGLAIDIAFRNENGFWWPQGDDKRWDRLEAHMLAAGLARGPSWDKPHFQIRGHGISPNANVRKLYRIYGQERLYLIWQELDMITVHYWDSHNPFPAP